MTKDIREARIKRALEKHPELQGLLDEMTDAEAVAMFAREQMTPVQGLAAGVLAMLLGKPVAGNYLVASYCDRLMHDDEDMGEMLSPMRSIVGRDDALAGKPCEAPDVGYLGGYCDALIEKDSVTD